MAVITFVVATRTRASGSAVLMRTYNNYPSTNAFHATILQAARATTAAPTLFLPIVINNIEYADGGVECNNPVQLALDEAHAIWPSRSIACLVSIGTGLGEAIQLGDNQKETMRRLLSITFPKVAFHTDVAKWCVKLLTSGYNEHLRFAANINRLPIYNRYFRFDVNQGLDKIGLADWDKADDIIALTDRYMGHEASEAKEKAAKFILNPSIPSSLSDVEN